MEIRFDIEIMSILRLSHSHIVRGEMIGEMEILTDCQLRRELRLNCGQGATYCAGNDVVTKFICLQSRSRRLQ